MQQSDRAGLLFALAGFCCLSVGDAVVKGMADEWPATAIAALRYVMGAIGLSAILLAREGMAPFRTIPKPGIQWLRGLGVAVATVCFFTGVWLMPLADAASITFMQPMLTAVLAAAFLGERLRTTAVIATIVAFGGVLIVLRPNFLAIGPAALLPLVAAFGMAILMTANRAARGSGSALAMQAYIACFAAPLLVGFAVVGHVSGVEEFAVDWPEWHVIARCAFVAVSASLAHGLVYMGTERAGAATVAPMTYGQLLVAITLGWLFFDEVPDLVTLLGAAIIIGSGLWLWRDGRNRRPEDVAR
ncbi:DMT family transporter [Aurantiacibacter spongiae]|uniref:DMT family transporter n=1 Tax=Aurantiacibacter spongiae TaxID=2488860 RepID=A0A3N5CUH6_9SPHN|nr:DMT family transporter [Aurantiacibacter spongiae]RPF72377.1 DMT family transporter [Aurantiacibacter spongiae]